MTLLVTELRRLGARRIFRMIVVAWIAGILISGALLFFRTEPVRPGEEARRLAAIDECVERRGGFSGPSHEFGSGSSEGRPLTAEAEYAPRPPEEFRREMCEDLVGRDAGRHYHLRQLPGALGFTTVLLTLTSWLLGASSIGGEWRAGTMTTMLTWEPRRVRLLLAKAGAVILAVGALSLVMHALLTLTLYPSAAAHGTTAGLDAGRAAGLVARAACLAMIGGAIGFSVGSLGRNTAAALGIGFIYLAVLEGGLLGNAFPGMRRWLLVGNAIVFGNGGSNAGDVFGRSVVEAGVLLAVYAAVLIAVAAATFRARDVS